jgi:two-component system cell cycle response regulator
MSAGEQSTSALLAALLEHDPSQGEHVRGVVKLSSELGHALHLGPEAIADLRIAATLHDIGKVAIPKTILDKPTSLNETEQAFIRTHTLVGETIMHAAPALAAAARLVRSSHERYDGAGYPDGLAGEQIPLGSRILFACDAFDAMTARRPYQPTRSPAEALNELRQNAGSQFDPSVASALIDLITKTPATHEGGRLPTPTKTVPTPLAA